MHSRKSMLAFATAVAILFLGVGPSLAADKIRIAAAQKGAWDTTIILFAEEKGFFKESGLELDIVYTDGGSDAQQAVIAGTMDIALSTGTLGVLTAWAKGAPIEVISAAATGAPDLLWYVKKDSPIKNVKDLGGRSVAFSRPGSSTHLIAQKVVDESGTKAKLVSTGGMPATTTAVMSGQVDVGWMVPPANAELLQKGEIRVLFTGNEAPGVKGQTIRVNAANRAWLEKNTAVVQRFLAAWQKGIDWAFSSDEAVQKWADLHKMPLERAKAALKAGYPKDQMTLNRIGGLEQTAEEAVETKRLEKPLSEAQKKDFVKWVSQLNKS